MYLTIRSVWVDGKLIRGAVNSTDAVFIDNNVFRCRVPLDKSIPSYLPDWKNTEIGSVLTKCFTQEEFQAFLERDPYGIDIYSGYDVIAAHKEKGKYSWINEENSRTEDFIPKLSDVKFKNAELLKEAKSIYKITNLYLASRDHNEKQSFYNEYHLHVMTMAAIYRQQIQNNIFDDKDAYFQLISETERIFGAGILSEPALI